MIWGFNNNTSKRIMDELEAAYLRLREIEIEGVAVIKLRVMMMMKLPIYTATQKTTLMLHAITSTHINRCCFLAILYEVT